MCSEASDLQAKLQHDLTKVEHYETWLLTALGENMLPTAYDEGCSEVCVCMCVFVCVCLCVCVCVCVCV